MARIPVSGPSITDKEVAYVAEAARSAWYENANVFHERFERAFAAYVGTRFAMALPSCTSAIHLSLLSLGVGPGDEVVVPDVTWIATAAPISYVGATPVFADIDPRTWCLTAPALERCLTPVTKAVIVVDLYGGMPADLDDIRALCRGRGVAVIEDAAEAVGSEHYGRKAGSLGDCGVFSFHGSKTLTTGEGGMLVGDREDIRDRSLFLRDHGRARGEFWNTEVAYKYKMSSLQAALGLAQLERIEELVARKREIFAWYRDALGSEEGITLNHEAPGVKSTYWMVTAVVDPRFGKTKEALIRRLGERDIDCRPMFYPLSSLPAYEGTSPSREARERNAVAYRVSPYGVNLPSGLNMTEELVRRVCEGLHEALRA
jgi:perosamine synthetase